MANLDEDPTTFIAGPRTQSALLYQGDRMLTGTSGAVKSMTARVADSTVMVRVVVYGEWHELGSPEAASACHNFREHQHTVNACPWCGYDPMK